MFYPRLIRRTGELIVVGSALMAFVQGAGWNGLAEAMPHGIVLWLNVWTLTCAATLVGCGIGVFWLVGYHAAAARTQRLWLTILCAWIFIPPYLQVAAWKGGIGRLGWLLRTGNLSYPWLEGMTAAIWMHAFIALPLTFLLGTLVVQSTPARAVELAAQHGGAWDRFRLTQWPTLRTLIGLMLVFNLSYVTTDMTITDLFGVDTPARELYNGLALGDSLWQTWRSTALPSLGVACLVFAGLNWIRRREIWRTRDSAASGHGGSGGIWSWAALLSLVCLVTLPIVNLCYKAGLTAFVENEAYHQVWSWTKWSEVMLRVPGKFREDIQWSLVLAGYVSIISLAVAVPASWAARRSLFQFRFWSGAAAVVMSIPLPLIALSVIRVLNQPLPEEPLGPMGSIQQMAIWLYDRTLFAPIFVTTLRVAPLLYCLLYWQWARLAARSEEHLKLHGASLYQVLRYLLGWKAVKLIGVALLLGLLLCIGDLAASILVINPGVSTFSIRIFDMLHAGVTDEVAGICLWVSATAAALGLLVTRWGSGR